MPSHPPCLPRKSADRGTSAIIPVYGGYSSVAERRSVAADVVGSKPTSRPKHLSSCHIAVQPCPASPNFRLPQRRSAFTLALPAGLIPPGNRSSILLARQPSA